MISTTGFVFALSAIAAFTIYNLLSRILAKESRDPLAFAAVYGTLSALFALPFLLLEPIAFKDITSTVIFITFLATVFFGVFEATQFFARKYLEASRLTIIFQLTPIITFAGSLLLLSESFSVQKLAAVALIVLGNIIAMYKHGGNITKIGLIFALATVTSLGVAYITDKVASPHYPLGFYMFLTYMGPAFYIFLFMRGDKFGRLKNELIQVPWQLPLLGFVSAIGYYLLLKTFQFAEASVAVPLIYTSTILTALGGILILRERSSIPQKILGAILVFAGVVLLR